LRSSSVVDADLAERLCDAQRRLASSHDRLWSGLHPDGLAAVCGEPGRGRGRLGGGRSKVLGAPDPLRAVQQVHWSIHKAFVDYQATTEERRWPAAGTDELIGRFVDALVAAGWSEEQARDANVHELASGKPATPRRN
jgi:hypothetical protein